MALAKTLTKMFPTPNRIGINLIVTDDDRPELEPVGAGAKIVISKTISRSYVRGWDMPNKIRDDIGEEAQRFIDDYKSRRAEYDKAAYQTKVNQINGALAL